VWSGWYIDEDEDKEEEIVVKEELSINNTTSFNPFIYY
jgi:hypothetical protein